MQTTDGQKLTHISLTLWAKRRQTLDTVLGVQVKFHSHVEFRQTKNGHYAVVDYFCEELDVDKAEASVMDDIDVDGLNLHGVEIEDLPYVAG